MSLDKNERSDLGERIEKLYKARGGNDPNNSNTDTDLAFEEREILKLLYSEWEDNVDFEAVGDWNRWEYRWEFFCGLEDIVSRHLDESDNAFYWAVEALEEEVCKQTMAGY